MPERTLESFEFRGAKPRTVGIIVILLILFILTWGMFVIVPAGWGIVAFVGKCGRVSGGGVQPQSPDSRESD